MTKSTEKPTPEVKALSLFLMAFKKTKPEHKDQARSMKKLWDLVLLGEVTKGEYLEEVAQMLESLGGYKAVIEKTVQFYINTTGSWKLEGNDQYCVDAKEIADKILKQKQA